MVAGYTKGTGRRASSFGALVLGVLRGRRARVRRQRRHRLQRQGDREAARRSCGRSRRETLARSARFRRCRRSGRATSSGSSRSSSPRSSSRNGRTTAASALRPTRACARTRPRPRCGARSRSPTIVRKGSRELKLSNLDKVFFPAEGITKGDLLEYYRAVAPVLRAPPQGPPVHDGALAGRDRRQEVLPEGRAVAHARLDSDVPRRRSRRATSRGRRSGSTSRSSTTSSRCSGW